MKMKRTINIIGLIIIAVTILGVRWAYAFTLNWGQWLGGQGGAVTIRAENYQTAAVNNCDSTGCVVVGGLITTGADFGNNSLIMAGSYAGGQEGFVVEVADGGSPSLLWGQYLGGNSSDTVFALAINGSSIYAGGQVTATTGFQIVPNGTASGGSEGFVIKLTDGGTPCLNWGKWLGGTGTDSVNAVTVNGGSIYAGGFVTVTTGFQIVPQGSPAGGTEGVVVKITDGGTPCLEWGQWLGGAGSDSVTALAINGSSIYVGGNTATTTGFQIVPQGTPAGGQEGFVVKVTDGGTPCLNWGQWLGGNSTDSINTVIVNGSNIYVGGQSFFTSNFQIVPQGPAGGLREAFVVKITDGGTPCLNWGQWLGGTSTDVVYSLVVNGSDIYAGGQVSVTTGFQIVPNGTAGGSAEGFVVKITDGGTPCLNWGQWLGGSGNDIVYALALNGSGKIYAGGLMPASSGLQSVTMQGTKPKGSADLFIAITDGGTPSLAWGQWLGRGNAESAQVNGLATNGSSVFIGGYSYQSFNFESAVFSGNQQAAQDGFVIKVTDGGTPSLNWGQWLGSDGTDSVQAVAVNGNSIYAAGSVASTTGLPIAPNGAVTGSPTFVVKITDGGTPCLNWGQWLGGTSTNSIYALTVSGGSIFAGGNVLLSTGFQINPHGPFGGGSEGFLVKITDGGTPCLNWGQWLGGNSGWTPGDTVYAVAVNGSSIYVGGNVGGTTGFQIAAQGNATCTNAYCGYVVKITDGGTPCLNWGQWMGTIDQTNVLGIAVDGSSIYAGGWATVTTGFSVATTGAAGGGQEGFVVKITDGGTPCLNWAHWLGGTGTDSVNSITVNGSAIYVGGSSSVTTGFQIVPNGAAAGGQESFLIKITDGGTPCLSWGQWIGGTGSDSINAVALSNSKLFVGGNAASQSGFQVSTYGSVLSTQDGFVVKITDPSTAVSNNGLYYDMGF